MVGYRDLAKNGYVWKNYQIIIPSFVSKDGLNEMCV